MRPSPAPWGQKDHEGRGIRVDDAEGRLVCLLHYPKEMRSFIDLRLILKAPEVLEKLKELSSLYRAATHFMRGDRHVADAADALIEEIESLRNAPAPPRPGEGKESL